MIFFNMVLSVISDPANDTAPISYRAYEQARNELWRKKYKSENQDGEVFTKSFIVEKPPLKNGEARPDFTDSKKRSTIVESVSPDLAIFTSDADYNGRRFFHMIISDDSGDLKRYFKAFIVIDTTDPTLIEMIHEEFVAKFKELGNVEQATLWLLEESPYTVKSGSNGQKLINLEKVYSSHPAPKKVDVS